MRSGDSGGVGGGSVGLSLVLPMWNEAAQIEETIQQWRQEIDRLAAQGVVERVEVVLVDDGSTDDTVAIVERLATPGFELRLVRHPSNRGLGAAVRSGFAAARGELVLYTDADLPFAPSALDAVLTQLRAEQLDVLAGYRLSRAGEGARRFVYSYVYNALVRVVLGVRVRDVNFAAKLVRREVLEAVELRSEGSFIDAELVTAAQRRGFRIGEFAAEYHPRTRGTSTLSSLRVIAGILREMGRLSPELRRIRPLSGMPSA